MNYPTIEDAIGKTPLVALQRLGAAHNTSRQNVVLAKLEGNNPAGSVKDRPALSMIVRAEERGDIKPGDTLIEATSGNTGIALAMAAAIKGYRMVLIMPEDLSIERVQTMKAFGAELILTPKSGGMEYARDLAEQMKRDGKGYVLDQFANMDNPRIHFETTGPEIFDDTDGKVDIFVAGVGTGGTVTGVGQYLKSRNPSVKVVAVEPKSSAVLSTGVAGPHKIQGIGAGFVPDVLDTKVYDEIIPVTNEDAFAAGKEIGRSEGVLVGISSGAALWAGIDLAKRPENAGKTIVVLLPDTGDRYLSTPLFAD